MYFGALSVGADIAGGIQVFYFSKKMDRKVSFAFKGMNAQFLKRAESDIIFESNEGQKIQKAMEKSLKEGSRINDPSCSPGCPRPSAKSSSLVRLGVGS